ncbi:hypothetical protein [Thalassovita mediterranea]|jgi:hypothetical protein|uniref:Uncharacterized protein n=1 Tax=Thalassovita mediterranea TaxID=340021 RepID=A0A0P1GQJ0_9RHOB|nr:hypothetical protein [Thalassovita mediterranea]CUH84605.1 hypothetical protein TM5383_01816 [Thalassovita mediterranea]SIS32249.1 hypothetical protein SAMN05421685_10658 [Thalassovita mediterranea]
METGIFKWLWRFNAFAIAFAAMLCTLGAALLLYEYWQTRTRDRYAVEVVNVTQDDDPSIVEDYAYGMAERLSGGDYLVPLLLRQQFNASGFSKTTDSNTINYLKLSPQGQEAWLFEGRGQLAMNRWSIKRPLGGKDTEIVAYTLEVVRKDTNRDQRLSDRDRKDLCLLDAAFSACTPVLTDHDSYQRVGETAETLTIAATRDKTVTLFTLSIADQTILHEQVLPAVETALVTN